MQRGSERSGPWGRRGGTAVVLAALIVPALAYLTVSAARHGVPSLSSALGMLVVASAVSMAIMAASALLVGNAMADGTGNESGMMGARIGMAAGYLLSIIAAASAGWFLTAW